jgi:hypothetical protein
MYFDINVYFPEDMDSKGDEQFSGSISSKQFPITLRIASEKGSEKGGGQLIQIVLEEAEETVVEGMQSHEKIGLHPGHEVIDPKPEVQKSTHVLQDAEKMSPDLREAIEKLRRRLRALGYRLPHVSSLIDTLRKTRKNPAKTLRKIAKRIPQEVKMRNYPRDIAQPEKPLTPLHEVDKSWVLEAEEWETLELYWAEKFKDAKPYHMATETVSFVTMRK